MLFIKKKIILFNVIILLLLIFAVDYSKAELNQKSLKDSISTIDIGHDSNDTIWTDDFGNLIFNGSIIEGPNAKVTSSLPHFYDFLSLTTSNGLKFNITDDYEPSSIYQVNYSLYLPKGAYDAHVIWNYSKPLFDIYVYANNGTELFGCNNNSQGHRKRVCLVNNSDITSPPDGKHGSYWDIVVDTAEQYIISFKFSSNLPSNISSIHYSLEISDYISYSVIEKANSNNITINTASTKFNGFFDLTVVAWNTSGQKLTEKIYISATNYFPPIIKEISINNNEYSNIITINRSDIINLSWKIEDRNKDELLISNLFYFYYTYNSWFVLDSFTNPFSTSHLIQFLDSLRFPSNTDLLIKLEVRDSFTFKSEKIIKFFIEEDITTNSENTSIMTYSKTNEIDTEAIPSFEFFPVLILLFILVINKKNVKKKSIKRKYFVNPLIPF